MWVIAVIMLNVIGIAFCTYQLIVTTKKTKKINKETADYLKSMTNQLSSIGANTITISNPPTSGPNWSTSVHATWVGTSTRRRVTKPSPGLWTNSARFTISDGRSSYRADEATEHHIGYVYGLRSFSMMTEQYLKGLYGARWFSPRMTAKCALALTPEEKMGVPHSNPCKCGINLYKLDTFNHILELQAKGLDFGEYSRNIASTDDVFRLNGTGLLNNFNDRLAPILAITKGWGKIVVHEDGYRVQKALVTDLYVRPDWNLGRGLPDGWDKRGVNLYTQEDDFLERLIKVRADVQPLIQIPSSESSDERRS